MNAVGFSSALTFVCGHLRDQTHRELVYRPLQFHKGSQYLIRPHNEPLSAAVGVNNPDRSLFAIQSRDPAQAPSGFAEIVSDGLPVLDELPCLVPRMR
jgi:hypothetical protein